ncbi:MAG: aminotransferase class V-fold PLP-dependent enzyme, partial [Parachlamydiales bacterium]
MIYLDNSATTLLDPAVLKAMLKDLKGPPYNPSASHKLGRQAFALLMAAREKIASLFKVQPEEIIFTASATEALNLVLRSQVGPGGHLISSELEHNAVYNTALELEKKGAKVTFLAPQKAGAVQSDQAEEAILQAQKNGLPT